MNLCYSNVGFILISWISFLDKSISHFRGFMRCVVCLVKQVLRFWDRAIHVIMSELKIARKFVVVYSLWWWAHWNTMFVLLLKWTAPSFFDVSYLAASSRLWRYDSHITQSANVFCPHSMAILMRRMNTSVSLNHMHTPGVLRGRIQASLLCFLPHLTAIHTLKQMPFLEICWSFNDQQ